MTQDFGEKPRSTKNRRAPSRAKACATLHPMPQLAPGISAIFPSSFLIQLPTCVTVLQKSNRPSLTRIKAVRLRRATLLMIR